MTGSVLAVDLGKTGCRAALWHGGTRSEADGDGAPGLAAAQGVHRAERAILAVARPLLHAAGLDRVDAAGVSAAGALTAPEAAAILARRLCASLPASRVSLASDAVASHAGALGGRPGAVLAVGTGAVALAVGPDGVLHRVDGLGPWLGDAGSGAAIGRAGLRAAVRAAENAGPATALLDAATARFGPLAGLAGRLAGDHNPAQLSASFAPDVIALAHRDKVAAGIVAEASAALNATARSALSRLPAGTEWPLAVVGGLAGRVGPAGQPPLGTALDGARLLTTPAAAFFGDAVVHATSGPAADRLDELATEAVPPGLEDLDRRPPAAIVHLALAAERAAQDALAEAAPALAALAEAVAIRMRAGGRLFYLGAGTPGRLATLDAAELAPTYSAPPGLVIPLLAGGPAAMVNAAEGAEDDATAAAAALDAHGLTAADAVVGIAASGRTPFVVAGLAHARARGALAGAIVNNPASPAAAAADIAVEILTGPEIVAGSTRMAAGTSQKIALNALSTACMVALGKTYGARMVDVRASNDKLRRRALRTVREVAGCTGAEAAAALAATGHRVKPAVVMLLAGVDAAAAEGLLAAHAGRIRDAIA